MWTILFVVFFIVGLSFAIGVFIGLLPLPFMIYAAPYTSWLKRERARGNIDWVWSDCIKSDYRKTFYHAKNATKWYWAKLRHKPHNIKYF